MTWNCLICEHENPEDTELCEVCGSYREEPCYDIESDLEDEDL
jgi:hypothetical protein